MNNIKIYKILEDFSHKKLNRFLKFVASPYFNANKNLIKLSNHVVKSIKTKTQLSKEQVFQDIFDETDFNDQKFRTINSQLLSLFEEFITIEEIESNELVKYRYLIQGINKNRLDGNFKKVFENSSKHLQRQHIKSSNFFIEGYFIDNLLLSRSDDFQFQKIINKKLTIHDKTKKLDIFYYLEKLKFCAQLNNFNRINKINRDDKYFNEVLSGINKLGLQANEAISTYILVNKILLNEDDIASFKELKNRLNPVALKFSKEENREIINNLLTFSVIRANKGDVNFYNELFELYEVGIETEAILINNELPSMSFRNAVMCAIKIGKTDYAQRFIRDNQHLLAKSVRDNAVKFSLARIAMHNENWKEAITNLSTIDFEDEIYDINARLMLLNAYYELKEYDALESLIDSSAVFLRRKKTIQESRKIALLNHVRYLRKILKLEYSNFSRTKIEQIIKEININTRVLNKNWLLQKLEELKD